MFCSIIHVVINMKKFALVLEGGAFRGVYTAGVLDVLLSNNIYADCVVGVSAGALNGLNYISKQVGRSAKININYCNDSKYIGRKALLKNKGIIGFDYLFGEISNKLVPFDYEEFNKSNQRFVAVATNCITGDSEYFEKNICSDIFLATQASSSMPLASSIVKINGIPYLDGAVSVPVPVKWAIEQGYEKIIVVLTRDMNYKKTNITNKLKFLYSFAYRKYPNLINKLYTMSERYNELRKDIDNMNNIFLIRPQKEVTVSRLEKDKEKLKTLYKQATEQTSLYIPKIKEYLD